MGIGTLKRAVFLDRDGVLNRTLVRNGKPYPPGSVAELEILPGVCAGLKTLHHHGYLLIVVTNQPDVARGTVARATVEALNAALAATLPLDEFRVCYHDDTARCNCRKPAPGLLLDAAREHSIDLAKSYLIGDRWRDIEAGQRAGCTSFFLDYTYQERRPLPPYILVQSFTQAVDWILEEEWQCRPFKI